MITYPGRPHTGVSSVTAYQSGPSGGRHGPPGMQDLMNPTLHNSQISQQTNVTTSLPIIIRPWMDKYEQKYRVGSVLFVRENSSNNRMNDVLDIPTMNHFASLRESKLPLNIGYENLPKGFDGKPHAYDEVKEEQRPKEDVSSKYNFFGVVRNDMMADTSLLTKLYNCDVWGRSMIANIFGKVKRGDRVGLVYAKVEGVTHYTPSGIQKPNIAFEGDSCYQVFGVVNGEERVFQSVGRKLYIPLGIVSHGISRLPSDGQIKRALRIQDDYILLPHIEILLM